MLDAIVIGGGPAGLQAALTLGRIHREVLVVDSGAYRNAPAEHLHNLIGSDGMAPADLRADARRDLARYDTVRVIANEVTEVGGAEGAFEIVLADGSTETSRAVVLATGVRDELPDIPGLAEQWGRRVAHCPFCHGHEFGGGRVVVQAGPHAGGVALMMAPIAAEVVIAENVTAVRAGGSGVLVTQEDGTEIDAVGFFVAPTFAQSAPFADQLGLELNESGCVRVDGFGRTSVPGVFAAGDLAHSAEFPLPMASVLNAAAAGLLAAASIVRDGVTEQLAAA
jgi:thioredoxin reductase